MATLFIFSGLPGTGKTTLAQMLARRLKAVYLRIDTIEQTLRESKISVRKEGYRVSYQVALDNLKLGLNVIADSCNPLEISRRDWEQVAIAAKAEFINIEIICSDPDEHRRRVETRISDIPGLKLPSWVDVKHREYHPWLQERIVIDTAHKSQDTCLKKLYSFIKTTGCLQAKSDFG